MQMQGFETHTDVIVDVETAGDSVELYGRSDEDTAFDLLLDVRTARRFALAILARCDELDQ